MLATSLLLAAAAAMATTTVDVPLYVATELAPETLQLALEEVDSLFAPGGIRFRWQISPDGSLLAPAVVVVLQARPPGREVYGCKRGLHDHRLGHTHLRARRVTLWTEQVARAVRGDWGREDVPHIEPRFHGRALGRVLAHELGHLFLGLDGHHDRGLMRKSFSRRSLVGRTKRAFRLPPSAFAAMRRTLTARAPAAALAP